jgi:hypothetical protein
LLWLIVAAGLALRLYHYLRDPAMWHDEAALVLNVLGKSFCELLGPLTYSEAAPPLFLWIEKGLALTLGESTYSLRLVPFVASCLALIILVAVASRLLSPGAVLWVALLAGCSDRLLWHACEAKPYATDVLVATGLVALVVWHPGRFSRRRLGLVIGLTPLCVFLSYPACFLLGGLALALLPDVIRSRRTSTMLLYGLFGIVLCGSFVVLFTGPIHAQRDATLLRCWQDMFAPWEAPWLVPGWVALRVSEVVRYACEPVGNVLAIVAVVGLIAFWRGGQRRLAIFLLAPLVLAATAALLGRYPIGATRVMVFVAPAALLLIARGLPPTLVWLMRFGWPGPAVLAGLALFPMVQAAYRVGCPWERAGSAQAAALVQQRRQPRELVLGTNWEHDYYFRRLGAGYQAVSTLGRMSHLPDQVWLVAAGKSGDQRDAWLSSLGPPGTWRVLEQHEFALTSVYHLEEAEASAKR